jgi:hypothetical protein
MSAVCLPNRFQNPFFSLTSIGVSETAERLRKIFEDMLEDCSQSVIIGSELEIIQELNNLWEECSFENWDGYGAKPIDPDSFSEAERFIKALPTTAPRPEISADPDGEISIDWIIEPRKVFSVSIGRRNEITYAGLFGSNKTYGREYFGDEIPKAISDNLDRLFL